MESPSDPPLVGDPGGDSYRTSEEDHVLDSDHWCL
jgi:hypothetical protein